MISNLTAFDQQYLTSLNHISDSAERAQRQLSTGLRLSQVSDDPDQVSTLLAARANLSSAQTINANLGRVKAETDSGEQALSSAVQLFERVRTLGTQAATDFATPDARNTAAQEIGSIMEQISGLSATQVEGRYIFSGDADQTAPYSVDLTQPNPVSSYLGSAATRVAQHPNGTTFAVSHTAQDIFDSSAPGANVFTAINNLRQALLNNDSAGIQTAVDGLTSAGDHLNNELAFYGTTQNKIAQATDFGNTLVLQLQSQISGIQDADASQAILELNQATLEQNASLSARAKLPRTSLFDYLG